MPKIQRKQNRAMYSNFHSTETLTEKTSKHIENSNISVTLTFTSVRSQAGR